MSETFQELYPFSPRRHKLPSGHELSYVDEGQGAPVLMVHGNPTWSFFYRNLIKAMSPRRRCIAPDHLGCGFSDKPADWSYRLQDHIDNLEHLVLSLDLRDITLVVHDWGGAIGCGVAVRHPERFKAVMVMNTAAFRAPRIPLRIALCRIPLLGRLAVRGFNAFAGAATFMTTVKPLSAVVKSGFIKPYDSWENRIATHEFVLDIPMRAGDRSYAALLAVESGLPKLAGLPMALVWGRHDWCFDLNFLARWRELFPKASVHELEAGHYLMEDAQDEVSSILKHLVKY